MALIEGQCQTLLLAAAFLLVFSLTYLIGMLMSGIVVTCVIY